MTILDTESVPLLLPAWERKGGRMEDSYDFPGYGERSPFFSPRGSGRAAGWETVMTFLDTESVPPLPLPVGERKGGRMGDRYDFPGYGEHSPSSPRGGAEERQDGRQL